MEENFEEAIQVEKDLASIHRDNDESEASNSKKNGKKNKEVKSDGKDVVIMQLQSEITNLKRSKREGKKPIKKKNTSHQIPPTSGIYLEDYVMDNFFHAHYANHLEKKLSRVYEFIQGNDTSKGMSRRRRRGGRRR